MAAPGETGLESDAEVFYRLGAVNGPLFLINLAATVVFLVLAIHAGWRGLRQRHYVTVAITVVLLALAIIQAELYGRRFSFDLTRLYVHLGCAFVSLGCLPGVVWSGLGLARGTVRRPVHRRWVGGFVLFTVLSVLTAGWMFLNAEAN
ncbi:MAG: hypothetical protein DWQ01_21710 [Planctomycetota bacterium]|nr:MAG: hypothetical protein DWQ01_21710 [Planctomycetota bacterium]